MMSTDSVQHTLLRTSTNRAVRFVNCLQVQYDTTTVQGQVDCKAISYYS
jgi:hypothetical protein